MNPYRFLLSVWDQSKASRFNWLWYDVTTYDAYTEETSYENSLMVQQSGTLALSSLTHVMRSLPLNARGIFLLLVQHQLDNKDNPNFMGTQAFVGFKCLVFGLVLTIVTVCNTIYWFFFQIKTLDYREAFIF